MNHPSDLISFFISFDFSSWCPLSTFVVWPVNYTIPRNFWIRQPPLCLRKSVGVNDLSKLRSYLFYMLTLRFIFVLKSYAIPKEEDISHNYGTVHFNKKAGLKWYKEINPLNPFDFKSCTKMHFFHAAFVKYPNVLQSSLSQFHNGYFIPIGIGSKSIYMYI